jgi:hypothetical protein
VRNGEDSTEYAVNIAGLLNDEGLVTPESGTTTAVIVPWGESIVNNTSNTITWASSEPTGGNDGDLVFGEPASSIAWDVWWNNGGSWTLKGNLNNSNAPLIHSDVSDDESTATTSEEDLKTDVVVGNTLANDDEFLLITALFYVNTAAAIDVTLKLYFGGEVIGTYSMSQNINGYYRFSANVYRTGASSQFFVTDMEYLGSPSMRVNVGSGTASETLSGNVTVKASSLKGSNGTSGDIVCKLLTIQKIS